MSKLGFFINKIELLIVILMLSFIHSCDVGDPISIASEKVLLEQAIDASSQDVTVNLDNNIEIVFPKGSVESGVILKITDARNISPMSTMEYKILKVYNVTLSNNAKLLKPITVTFFYDQSKLDSGVTTKDLSAAYYNDYIKKWDFYKNIKVDSLKHTVSFETDHLTPLSLAEFITTGGYQHKFVTKHFCIYYTYAQPHALQMSNYMYLAWSDDAYKELQKTWLITEGEEKHTDYFIQDLGHYLECAYDVFNKQFPDAFTNGMINVYLKKLEGADGEYGVFTGSIYIHNNLMRPPHVQQMTYPEILQTTSAHELFHYIQDTYYLLLTKKIEGYLWWLESTAICADRIVWNNLRFPDSYVFSKERLKNGFQLLSYNLPLSWDDCEPEAPSPSAFTNLSVENYHYIAGIFLTYLMDFDNEVNLDLPALIKLGGEFSTKNIRTVLNSYLESNHNTSIGMEFAKYVRWLFEGQPNSSISYTIDYTNYDAVPSKCTPVEAPVILDKKTKKRYFNDQLPYLSARIIKIKDTDDTLRTVRVKAEFIPEGISVFLYNVSGNTKSMDKELKHGDSVDINIPLISLKDIIVVNTSKDNLLVPKISFELVKKTFDFLTMLKNTTVINIITDSVYDYISNTTLLAQQMKNIYHKIEVNGNTFNCNVEFNYDSSGYIQTEIIKISGKINIDAETVDIDFEKESIQDVTTTSDKIRTVYEYKFSTSIINLPFLSQYSSQSEALFWNFGNDISKYLKKFNYEKIRSKYNANGDLMDNEIKKISYNDLIHFTKPEIDVVFRQK